MAKEPMNYPQVTPEQVQLWESNPVTQSYLKCLEWKHADVKDDASSGAIVDSSCADLTHALIHKNIGQQEGLVTATNYNSLFAEFNIIMETENAED